SVLFDILIQNLGNGIGAGKYLLAALPDGMGAADSLELLHHLGRFHSRPQGQGSESSRGFRKGSGAAASLTDGGEHFTDTLFIGVDGHIQGTAARFDAHCLSPSYPRPLSRCRTGGSSSFLSLLLLLMAYGEHFAL